MKGPVYEQLYRINGAFKQAIEGLTALRQFPPFHARELERCVALVKETRAVANSHLVGVIEDAEVAEAGRRYRQRRLRERKEERNGGG